MMKIARNFPLDTIQSGAKLGNGLLGAMIWGSGRLLHISVGCASLWDHRGGLKWSAEQNFRAIREALEHHDKARIDEIFTQEKQNGVSRPILLSLGRVDLTLPEGAELLHFEEILEEGLTRICYSLAKEEHFLEFCADMSCRNGMFCRGLSDEMTLELTPAWELQRRKYDRVRNADLEEITMKARGFEPPEVFAGKSVQAFLQRRPADPAFGLKLERRVGEFGLAFSADAADLGAIRNLPMPEFGQIAEEGCLWWKNYWKRVPELEMESPALTESYLQGMYQYGIMTNPAGVTPGLQGPWIEDDRLPPWSGDYHFNINVQLCNGPGMKAGLFDHLRPVFDMIFSWKDKLRQNAECFAGIRDGYMLPHAVDDRGTCMGAFWTGNIDHACSAWMAQMMFDYCDYSGDREYLRTPVFDFMKGVMNVFKVMLDSSSDGGLSLPVSISPEYRGSGMDAWGRNSSFQLAAIHNLAKNLRKAAAVLEEPEDPFWKEVSEKLPEFSVYDGGAGPEIGLWDGLALEESHRHHSHLAGICPFDVLDPSDPELKDVLQRSLRRWTEKGCGLWSGWCVPWAAQIWLRMGQPETAVYLLETWRRFFNNAGGGSLHDADLPGFTIFHSIRSEVMQMDGAMGAVSAIQDLMAYSQNGVIHVFGGIPRDWQNASFRNLHLPGGFTVSGKFRSGHVGEIQVTAAREQELRLRTPEAEGVLVQSMRTGETAVFTADKLKTAALS